jgi:predicted O-linked N-acetylglucosamine transferase (SPINDLY family)
MGVPVVNLRGSTHAGRVGQALLQRAGLGHLSTSTLEGYGDIAIALAADLAALAALRAGLRQQAQAALGDGAQLTREIESAYRRFWMEWCARRPPDAL